MPKKRSKIQRGESMNGKVRRNAKTAFVCVMFIIIVSLFFYLLTAGTMPKYVDIMSAEEIAATDLSKECACIGTSSGEYYKGRLYTPADFVTGDISQGNSDDKYATFRIVLPLDKGVTYGMSGESATYAQRVYINGVLVNEIGTVCDNARNFIPTADKYTVYFTPQTDTTEIIIQHAWFNHRTGAVHKLSLATAPIIAANDRAQTICEGLIAGTLLAMAIFFFGMFLLGNSRYSMLWFSLSCLAAALHYLIYESKQIGVLFPYLDWYTEHKLEYITNILYFVFMLLYAFAALGLRPHKQFVISSAGVAGAILLFYIITPSTLYTRFTVALGAVMTLYLVFASVYTCIMAIKRKSVRRADSIIVCITVAVTAAVNIIEGMTYFTRVFYIRSYATILFVFCNAVMLTVSLSRTERYLDQSKQRESEVTRMNETLEKLDRLKTDFMHNIAHEMKTPLTVMSGYAQLTEKQIEKNVVNDETLSNLETISSEAQRLSDMVTKLLSVSQNEVSAMKLGRFGAEDILADAAAVCRPILAKRGNRLITEANDCPDIIANHETLLQVLINLAVNSGRHTENGTVTFSVKKSETTDNFVMFTVSDTGTGIFREALSHLFDKGYSTDGGNGLGLYICREIIESMGGEINAESSENGAVFRFTVPCGKEDEK